MKRNVLAKVALVATFSIAATLLIANQAIADVSFLCLSGGQGLVADKGRLNCGGKAIETTDDQAVCMYETSCVPATQDIEQLIFKVTGKRAVELKDDELAKQLYGLSTMRPELFNSRIPMAAQCIGSSTKCPGATACINSKNALVEMRMKPNIEDPQAQRVNDDLSAKPAGKVSQ